jgi:flagellar motor switch protein FliM
MRETLSPDEMDALLEGLGSIENAAVDRGEAGAGGAQLLDLALLHRVLRGPSPVLDVVSARLARHLQAALFDLLDRDIAVAPSVVTSQRYQDFVDAVPGHSSGCVMSFKPLPGKVLAVCEPALAFALVDLLHGGQARAASGIEDRPLSALARVALQPVLQLLAEGLTLAWRGVYPLGVWREQAVQRVRHAHIATPQDRVFVASFELQAGDIFGGLHLCMPRAVLDPLGPLLAARTPGDFVERDGRWPRLLAQEIQAVEVDLKAQFAPVDTTLAAVLALKAGDFIELPADGQYLSALDGLPLFAGQDRTHQSQLGFQIDRPWATSMPPTSSFDGEDAP